MMDITIKNAEDIKKIERCEILRAQRGTVDNVVSLRLTLRTLDETVFTLYLVPGARYDQVGNQMMMHPTLAYMSRAGVEPDAEVAFHEEAAEGGTLA